ncbi:MAG: OmpA family protein, partial [Myxococcales bacterium]|nr:OmpA family protein [Myxococcales bacterium]
PKEGQPQLPPWFPEKPWTASGDDDVFFEGKVVFDTAKSTIRPESEKVLQELLQWLKDNPQVSQVRLEGHTDSRAGEEYNQKLSERRALAVADWLVDHGLDNNRILAVAFGETAPLATNGSPVGRQENRRTSFYPAEVDGRRFLGKDPTNGGLVLTVLSKEEREALERKGEVPTFTPPPLKIERDVIKRIDVKKFQEEQTKDLLREEPPVIDAATGAPDKQGDESKK